MWYNSGLFQPTMTPFEAEDATMFDPFLTISSAFGILFEIVSTTIAAFLVPIEGLVIMPLTSILSFFF